VEYVNLSVVVGNIAFFRFFHFTFFAKFGKISPIKSFGNQNFVKKCEDFSLQKSQTLIG
jgi:hypothetical protein